MILVTGGAGYIGSHVMLALQAAGFEVMAYDNLVYGHAEFVPESMLCRGDLEDRAGLKRLFAEQPIEAVIHMAAYAYVGESVTKPALYYRNNVYGTLCLLETMVEAGVKSVVFSSTCATYGEPQQIPIPESHPQHPINPYGYTKLVIEQMLKDFDRAYGLRSVAFRYFNAAGADPEGRVGEDHDPETHLIPLVLDAAIGRRGNITVFGNDYPTPDGTCVRDYIHVTDLADAHVLGMKYLRSGGETTIFNLGNGNGFSVQQVIDTARRVTGKEITQVLGPRRPGDPAELIGTSERARQVLGWLPRYADLEAILTTAWRWHQSRFGQ